jgi:DNA-binding NarL/FixJ family response regulator
MIIKIIDGDQEIEREMTTEELAVYEANQAEYLRLEKERQDTLKSKLDARQSAIAKLSALGLTESEINTLIGGV